MITTNKLSHASLPVIIAVFFVSKIPVSYTHLSGGRIIAQKVAEKLGIVYYDNEIIDLAAKEMGFDVDVIRKVSEQKASGFMYSLSSGTLSLPLNDQVYTMQSKIIRHLANYDACIIVSGCADYILEDYDNCLLYTSRCV